MKTLNQKGFTLVEIAIVLVVIGLLLGGILKGQQLIDSARVRNLADQNSGIQAAYYGFIDRFRNLPGDMLPTAACTNVGAAVDASAANCAAATVGGDANGIIDTVREAAAVWSHLSVAGFLTGTYDGKTAADALVAVDGSDYALTVPNNGVPANAFQGAILLAHLNDYVDGANTAQGAIVRLAYSFGGNIPVPLLRDLDQKLDDGVAGTGVLRSAFGDGTPDGTFGTVVEYTPGGDDCLNAATPATWAVDSSNQGCNAIFLY